MKAVEKPAFEADPHKRVYRCVERRGAVDPEAVREYVDLDADRFHGVVSDLKRDGYLEEANGALRVALETGGEETYSTDDIEYTVRPAREGDLSGIVEVIRRTTDEKTYVVAESVAEQLLYEDTVIRHNDGRSRLFFVATVDGTVVGWTHLDASPVEKLRHTAQQTVGVLEPYRGYGIGGRLLRRGLVWAVDNGFEKVYNSLPATNGEAIGFLESYGWEAEAIRRDHYSIDGEYVDEVMMAVYPAEVTDTPDGTNGSKPGGVSEDIYSANAKRHLDRALEAADTTAVRFHVRHALQFVELGIHDSD